MELVEKDFPQSDKLLFEQLPDFHAFKIALMTFSRYTYSDALRLISLFPSWRLSVLRALAYEFRPSDSHAHLLQYWISLFENLARSINFAQFVYTDFPRNLPVFPNLHFAMVNNLTDQLDYIAKYDRLARLVILWWRNENLEAVIHTLRRVKVTHLSFVVLAAYLDPLPTSETSDTLKELAEACASVERLDITSAFWKKDQRWRLIRSMPNLQRLTVYEPVCASDMDFLHSLDEVELFGNNDIKRASTLGSKLRGVSQWFCLPEEHLQYLERCPELRELQIVLEHGSEAGLVGVIPSLVHLYIHFRPPILSEDEEGDEDSADEESQYSLDDDVIMVERWRTARPENIYIDGVYFMSEEVFKSVLISAPNLKEIEMEGTATPTSMIEMIAKTRNSKLETLKMEFDVPNENVVDRFLGLTNAMHRWCPNMQSIELLDAQTTRYVTKVEMKKMEGALRALARKTPWLQTRSLETLIDAFEIQEDPVNDEDMQELEEEDTQESDDEDMYDLDEVGFQDLREEDLQDIAEEKE